MKSLLFFFLLALSATLSFSQISIEAQPQKAFVKQLSASPQKLLLNWQKQPWDQLFGFFADETIGETYPALKEGFVIFTRVEIFREGALVFEAEAPAETSFPGNILFPGTICFPGNILFPGTILDQLGEGEFEMDLSCRLKDRKLNEALQLSGKHRFSFQL